MKALNTPVSVEEVDGHPVLAELPPPLKERVAARARVVRLARGEPLFQRGDPARRIYYCRSGELKLFRLSDSGGEKIVNLIHPGRSFAEATMFMPRRLYPVYCTALKASELIAYDADDLSAILRDSPDVCFQLLGLLSRRLHEKIGQIEALSLQNARMRIAGFLLAEAEKAGGSGSFELEAGKKYVANFLGVKPETFSRVISAFRDDGLLRTEARRFVIADRDRLGRIARGQDAV